MENINIEKLISEGEIVLYDFDIFYSCRDDGTKQEYYEYLKIKENLSEEERKKFIGRFVEKNIKSIDLEKLLLYGIRNKQSRIDVVKKQLPEYVEKANNVPKNDVMGKISAKEEVSQIQQYIKRETEKLEKLKKSVRKIDILTASAYFNSEEKRPDLEILDSKQILTGKKNSKTKNIAKADKFFNKLKEIKDKDANGMEAFFYVMPITEAVGMFPNPEFREEVFDYCLNTLAYRNGLKTQEAIQIARNDEEEFYDKYLKGRDGEFLMQIVYPSIMRFAEYADIDKLVMVGAYRLEEALEREKYPDYETEVIRKTLVEIANYCKEYKIPPKYKLELAEGEWNTTGSVQYSLDDIDRCLNKFVDGRYIDNKELEGLKNSVEAGNLYLTQLPGNLLDVMFNQDDFERLMFLNDRNFKDSVAVANLSREHIIGLAARQGLDSSKILNLLLDNNVIDYREILALCAMDRVKKDTILEILKGKDKSSIIDYETLIYLYENEKSNVENKEKYERYLDLSKGIIDQSVEEGMDRIEFSEKFMEYFAENYDSKKRETYIRQLENFYKEGLLDIKSIINWEDEAIVARFLKDRVIDSTVVKELMSEKTISVKYAQSLFGECILDPDMDNESRIKFIKSGLISSDYIGKAYQLNLIKSSVADELSEEGYFEKSKYDNVSIEELQSKTKIKLGDLRSLNKIGRNFQERTGKSPKTDYIPSKDKGILIDPDAREKLFELLRARKAESLEIQQGDPFYNYEFYVLPDENHEYGPNSVVIAERYFMNKDTMKTFATQNATYFFKWRDLLYISNLKKSEIAKESKDIVFRAHHVVSDGDDKTGHWGESVLFAVGKTMMGREVRKYQNKKLKEKALGKVKSIYRPEEWEKVNDHAIDIDVGEYTVKNLTSRHSFDDEDPYSDGLR